MARNHNQQEYIYNDKELFNIFIGLGCEFGDLGKIDIKEHLNNFHTIQVTASCWRTITS
jgi:hypothetical protein